MLRLVVGVSTIVEAGIVIAGSASLLNIGVALLAMVAGAALVLGFVTPVVSSVIAISGVAATLGLHGTVLSLLDSRMALFEFIAMAAALAVLGPGAASIDARLFGRREVPIRDPHRPEDL